MKKILVVIILILIIINGMTYQRLKKERNNSIQREKDIQEIFDGIHFTGAYKGYICFTGKDSLIVSCDVE